MTKSILLIFILTSIFNLKVLSQDVNWFGKSTIESIVLLQKFENGQFVNHGVGILTSHNDFNLPIIITCEHVLRNNHIYIVVNAESTFIHEMKLLNKSSIKIGEVTWQIDGNRLRTKVDLIQNVTFFKHPDNLDIAAFPLEIGDNYIISGVSKPFTETTFIGQSHCKDDGMINLGEEIYFVGFPFGIGANQKLEPLLRSGAISWKSSSSKIFLLDAISYGGNSGSPIFTKMSPLSKQRITPYFIGMVTGHLGEEKENFGLATCVYYKDIETVIKMIKEK